MRTALLVAVVSGLSGCDLLFGGGGDDPDAGGNGGPVMTPVGNTTGAKVSARIGAAGGTLSTVDGRIVLEVPAGALGSEVELSLTPLSNNAPLGVGAAVRLEPNGTAFTTPAKLVLHYAGGLPGTSEDLLIGASQDATGVWQVQSGTVDSTAKTFTLSLAHFSDWSFGACAKLDVDSYVLSPGVEAHLAVVEQCDRPPAAVGPMNAPRNTTRHVDWKKEGNMAGSSGPGMLMPMGPTATVVPPSSAPSDPMVRITATYTTADGNARELTEVIAVDTLTTLDVDGHSLVIGGTSSLSTMNGKSTLSAANSTGSIGIIFPGTGEGGFTTDPQLGLTVQADVTPSTNYNDSYVPPCGGPTKYLTSMVSVSHANRERQFIVGSFSGTVSVVKGKIQCGVSMVDDIVEVPISGMFVTRWLVF